MLSKIGLSRTPSGIFLQLSPVPRNSFGDKYRNSISQSRLLDVTWNSARVERIAFVSAGENKSVVTMPRNDRKRCWSLVPAFISPAPINAARTKRIKKGKGVKRQAGFLVAGPTAGKLRVAPFRTGRFSMSLRMAHTISMLRLNTERGGNGRQVLTADARGVAASSAPLQVVVTSHGITLAAILRGARWRIEREVGLG